MHVALADSDASTSTAPGVWLRPQQNEQAWGKLIRANDDVGSAGRQRFGLCWMTWAPGGQPSLARGRFHGGTRRRGLGRDRLHAGQGVAGGEDQGEAKPNPHESRAPDQQQHAGSSRDPRKDRGTHALARAATRLAALSGPVLPAATPPARRPHPRSGIPCQPPARCPGRC
jgi:hypothetical protein